MRRSVDYYTMEEVKCGSDSDFQESVSEVERRGEGECRPVG